MYRGKPIIGIVGGIGSGKSFVARLLGGAGCVVIDSDQQVTVAYQQPQVRAEIRKWWGDAIFTAAGTIDRAQIARHVFADPVQRKRLEGLIFPVIAAMREEVMSQAAGDAQVVAYVWDAPLLFEADLARSCDAVVFVDAPLPVRLKRVAARGWKADELAAREKSQLPLYNKREMSDYTIDNAAGADQVRTQVRDVLSRILAAAKDKAPAG